MRIRTRYRVTVVEKGTGVFVDQIERKPWAEQIGNFNPLFCRYEGKRCLLQSNAGDLSDPFRRKESYGESLFIEVERRKP